MTTPVSPSLAVVIVAYLGWSDLRRCLQSLTGGEVGGEMEIVVVNNGPGGDDYDALRRDFSSVRFVDNPGNPGFAHACNAGLRASSAPEILFLNPDCVMTPEQAFELHRRLLAHPECAALAPRQVDADGRPQKVFDRFPACRLVLGPVRGVVRLLMPGSYGDPRRCTSEWRAVDWVTGSALLTRRTALESVAGWCEDYWMYSEDVDLCRRLQQQDGHVVFTGAVTIEHRHGGSSRHSSAVSALTRAEVIVSRHLYAHRHMSGLRRPLYHTLLVLGRVLPLALAAAVDAIWPFEAAALGERAGAFRHLVGHYRDVRERRLWVSRRSAHFPADSPT